MHFAGDARTGHYGSAAQSDGGGSTREVGQREEEDQDGRLSPSQVVLVVAAFTQILTSYLTIRLIILRPVPLVLLAPIRMVFVYIWFRYFNILDSIFIRFLM